jgi:hypothetical protein
MSIKISYSLLAPSLQLVACKRFLVAHRGRTQWVRNAEAAGEVTLKKGNTRQKYGLRLLGRPRNQKSSKPIPTLSAAKSSHFPVPAGLSPLEAFAKLPESLAVHRQD